MGNKYVNRSKISEAKFRELVKLFTLDLTATQIAELSGLNRNTVNRYLKGIRKRIAEYCDVVAPFLGIKNGEISDAGFTEVSLIGIREKNGAIHTALLERQDLSNDLSKLGELDIVIDLKDDKQIWLRNRQQLRTSKINCIDGFRGFAKSRLEKFKGLHPQTLFLHLRESEFRYNNNKSELYHLVLKIIRKKPLF